MVELAERNRNPSHSLKAVRSGRAHLIRRLGGCGGVSRPWRKPMECCKMLKTNPFPADAQLPGEKCGLVENREEWLGTEPLAGFSKTG